MNPTTARTLNAPKGYSPESPYDCKGEWIRHDLLELTPATAKRVLSIGCGSGHTEALLQQGGAEVWGIDISAEAVAKAAQRLHHAQVADVEEDGLHDLKPGSFDLVLCGDVLEHLRFTEHVLRRIHGWLAEGGHVIVGVPNATHHSVLRTLVLRRDWKYEDAGLFDRGHYRLFTRKSLVRMLAENGFEVEEVKRSLVMGRLVKWTRVLLRPLFWLLPFLDEYVVYTWTVRARKVAAG